MIAVDYGSWTTRVSVLLTSLVTAPSTLACTVCFGDADDQAAQGAVDAAIVLGVWAYAVIGVGVGIAVWKARRGGRSDGSGARSVA